MNAAPYLPELLRRLNNQSHSPYEIIVVDSSSKDDTVDIAINYGTRVLKVERRLFDHGGTRNYAASHASGEVLVFLTQDALPEDHTFLEALIQPLQDPTVAAVYGRQVPQQDASVLEKMTREFNYASEPLRKSYKDIKQYGIKTFFFTNVCSAIRGESFHSIGGFPEPIIVNEDMIVASRFIISGLTIAYNPVARVIHSHNYTLVQLFKRYFDIGVSLRMHDWLLGYTNAEGEGKRLVKAQYLELRKRRMWYWIPKLVADSAVRYLGYRMGLTYWAFPRAFCRLLSMHNGFWSSDKLEAARRGRDMEKRDIQSAGILPR